MHLTQGDAGFFISGITLTTRGVVSRALSAVPMTLDAQLVTG